MSVTAQEWTVSGLAAELKRDRRTIAKIIDTNKLRPVTTKGRYDYYHMVDIVNAMLSDTGVLALDQEQAKLAAERRRQLQRQNDEAERELLDTGEVVDALQNMSKQAVSILEALPLNIKRRVPVLKNKDIEFIKSEIVRCRNIIADIKIKGG